MPRSKRAKVVHLSKVTKKGREHSVKLFSNVQSCVGSYPYIYIFSVDNMRNSYLKDVRSQLSDSRLFFGSTKLLSRALGRDAASEPAPGTSLLSPHLHGSVGLIFSPRPPAAMAAFVASFHPTDYARAGATATRDITIPEGAVFSRAGEIAEEDDVPFPPAQEPALRALGVPTRLLKGRVTLSEEFEVCKEGEELDAKQANLLKMFGVAMAEFSIELVAVWDESGTVIELDGGEGRRAEGMEVDDDG